MSSETGPTPPTDERPPAVPVVALHGLSKVYSRALRTARWRAAVPWLVPTAALPHVALDDVDLEIGRGEAIGIIGANGAGKTTLLKVVAGVTQPTKGSVGVTGRVGSMIELGVGFHPELTGWENVRCTSAMHGIGRSDLRGVLGDIAEFSGIRDAMDTPVKHYSLGMRARLAFAVATQFPCEVLVVDEVLAVGDQDFQQKCFARIQDMVAGGTTLLFVSHAMTLVTLVCSRVVRLDRGRLVDDGPPDEVVERYLSHSPVRHAPEPDPAMVVTDLRGNPEVPTLGHQEISAEVEVRRAIPEPRVAVDFLVPNVDPDRVISSSLAPLPGLQEPGRYRITGRSSEIPMENGTARFTVRLLDDRRTAAVGSTDCRVLGEAGRRRGFPMDPTWEIGEAPTTEAPRAQNNCDPQRSADATVTTEHLTKTYHQGRRGAAVRAALPGGLGWNGPGTVHALDDLGLMVGSGQALGIIGPNGAGKTTLLRMLAALLDPDRGRWRVDGQVVPLLDLGAGMHPDMTGRENLEVCGRLLGISRNDLAEAMDRIVAFAGIGDALDAPVRQYSSGMRARLGFALGLEASGRVLLIDEVLAVGDEDFRRAALAAVSARRRKGDTVLFVSHELQLVEQLCDRVVRIDRGRVLDDGPASGVIERYGGRSWAGGVADAVAGIRVSSLTLKQRHIAVGGSLDATGTIVVDTPSPGARLEVSYRVPPEDRDATLTSEDRERQVFAARTLEPAGGALATAGTYQFRLGVDRNAIAGRYDLVLSVHDDREDEEVVTETWQEIRVGPEEGDDRPHPLLEFEWTVVPLAGERDPQPRP